MDGLSMEDLGGRTFESVDEILNFAIRNEVQAEKFYRELAEKMQHPAMTEVFKQFALEEKGHQERLAKIKLDKQMAPVATKVMNLKIGDYLVDIEPSENMGYQEALILAMKREKAAFHLYTDLAALTDNDAVRQLFESLAMEEAKHKLRFELEYDDNVLREN